MASSRFSRNLFWSGLWIYSLATGLASMIFMAWAFYVETTGRGALFIEPNRVLAAGELATVATGMIALLILFFRGLSQKEEASAESLRE
jgi:hypothetical protein